ncbi:MAG: EAP30/Vps36 family vacuolar-sorting protein [Candidatus Heimdallarchaeota archaeon]|nr:EAP30/Vps36 family vacuolar-sorting protein [Candidatus Heimdallarchaeota archaeon]MDH5645554.1 EAP30/Vps36 family vacuolar-sorting protein [Candidatus Heimdallarchaeota archaeon]
MSSDEDKERKRKDAFANFANSLINTEIEDKEAKDEILREGIAEREKNQMKTISSSRMLTAELSKARQKAGLSAFVGTSGKIKSPKFNRSEFLELLSREVLLIGSEEIKDSGGILSIQKIYQHFNDTRPNWELRDSDIEDAIKVLVDKELIPGIETINKELSIVHFIPSELSTDTREILKVSSGIQVTIDRLVVLLNWQRERVNSALNQLVLDGIAVMAEEEVYFPGL